MAEVSAALVKTLREKSGAGMMDCKKALAESGGDIEAAVDWLRKKGLSAAAKKAGRVAAEGLCGVAAKGTVGAVLEVNAETDFVARNDKFQAYVSTATQIALQAGGDIEKLGGMAYPGTGRTIKDELTQLIATIGENMALRRTAVLTVKDGVVASYIHAAVAPGLGKIGVLVALESTGDKDKLNTLGKQIAMHVAAASPLFLTVAAVDNTALARERAVLVEQARASGKPDAIIEKMVDGRIRKYYEEVVLLEQVSVIDGETKIAKLVEQAAKGVGAPVALTGFVRFALGEGIDRPTDNFAEEVAKVVGS